MTTDPNYSPWQLLPAPEPCTVSVSPLKILLHYFKSILSYIIVLFHNNVDRS